MASVVDRDGCVGISGFPGLLVDKGLLTRNDLVVAEQHARREKVELVDAVAALGLIPEVDVYRVLAAAIGHVLASGEALEPSELAVRLVPERVARRYLAAPLRVDNRTLTYA